MAQKAGDKPNTHWAKLPADFAKRFGLPPDLVQRLKAAAALSPEVARKVKQLAAQSSPEVHQVFAAVAQKRRERQAIDELLQIYETWLADRGVEAPAARAMRAESPPAIEQPPESPKPPSPSETPEAWLIRMRPEFLRLPQRRKSKWVRETAYPQMKRELGDAAPWDSWQSLKRALYGQGQKKI
jgi:hypothetical protein